MSPKKETLPLFLSLIATISLIFGGSWFLMERWAKISSNMTSTSSSNNSQNLFSNSVSFGEKILISNDVLPDKKDAAKAILDKNYQQAITNLTSSLKIKPNDP
ncbi:MAG: receptor ligand binding family protein, partial [Dolichospermum sp.]